MQNRRQFLAKAAVTAAAAGASFAAPALARAATAPADHARLNALFDEFMAQQLRHSPESATALGLDKGALGYTKALWSDSSETAVIANKGLNVQRLQALRSLDRKALSGMDAINYDTVDFVMSMQVEGDRRFDYGTGGSGSPYVLSQLSGAYQSAPDFLDNQHAIETREDADAYLSRLEGLGRVMDNEVEIARHDEGLGVIPPDFVIERTLEQMKTLLAMPTDKAPMVESIARRAAEKKIDGDWAKTAARLYEESFRPALQRQVAHLTAQRTKAVHDAGVWRLPKGDEYYAVSLETYTTAKITPDEVHQTGLDLVKDLSSQMDVIMRKQGMTKGSVGARLKAMYEEPKYRYPNTDEGKEKLIADLNLKVKEVTAKLPGYFGALPKGALQIRRVPKAIEAGAPGGYYNPPPLDNSRPGIYWINLRDTAEVPSWTLPTLTFHEGIPGHHLQGAISNEAGDLPLIRKAIWFSGYGEGWALYAEQLAVEMGMYDKDPLGHIGMLHDALFRAVRLVVDSGMHHKKWSREQATKYYVDTLGDKESGALTEIERYCVWPGQACSYMVGKLTWLRLRDKARKALGPKFDIKKFHDAGLLAGATPLTVLEHVIDDYIASAKA